MTVVSGVKSSEKRGYTAFQSKKLRGLNHLFYNTRFTPGIILTIHVSRKARMVVTIPMKRNLPRAPIQMLSTTFCRTIISNKWNM